MRRALERHTERAYGKRHEVIVSRHDHGKLVCPDDEVRRDSAWRAIDAKPDACHVTIHIGANGPCGLNVALKLRPNARLFCQRRPDGLSAGRKNLGVQRGPVARLCCRPIGYQACPGLADRLVDPGDGPHRIDGIHQRVIVRRPSVGLRQYCRLRDVANLGDLRLKRRSRGLNGAHAGGALRVNQAGRNHVDVRAGVAPSELGRQGFTLLNLRRQIARIVRYVGFQVVDSGRVGCQRSAH